jgi:molybdopterin/thiamine biosynthesis adenylyltransferase/proteasome lid subunit RPN8/RPN11
MASSTRIRKSVWARRLDNVRYDHVVIVRMADPEASKLFSILLERYPAEEWASFVRFGWRESNGQLILTLAAVDVPEESDLDREVPHVAIDESYSLRIALLAEMHPHSVGIVHSHPKNYQPAPSLIDDDMDGYYSQYLESFAPGRPYVSLIVSELAGELTMSGRVYWRGAWHSVTRFVAERYALRTWPTEQSERHFEPGDRYARLAAAYGDLAAERLRRATVAIIGAGGTGSAAIEVLARAGVGRLIIVDPDVIESSNLERLHGSTPADASSKRFKVEVAAAHVRAINPECDVVPIVGSVPQTEVVDAIVTADLSLGCTDQQHSRLALSDLSVRYLLPSIDCGVAMEGSQGKITGQIIQMVRFVPSDPCALCRRMIDPPRLAQELMSDEERQRRRAAAEVAVAEGREGGAYWRSTPQLNTVGYLTTVAGAMAAGYAIGWLTGRFDPPFERLQMNLVARWLDVTDDELQPDPNCVCRRVRGWADQGNADALITAPAHWGTPILMLNTNVGGQI